LKTLFYLLQQTPAQYSFAFFNRAETNMEIHGAVFHIEKKQTGPEKTSLTGPNAEPDRLHHLVLHRVAGDHLYIVPQQD
jgi:hypothetical protein